MKIGVFDSGLGGLLLLKAITLKLPDYDYVYLGDTKRVPYGNRSEDTIYEFLKEGIEYLFKQDCQLIIVACNTASARALRRIQQEYLPEYYSDRRVLGVIIPAVEVAVETNPKKVGVLATTGTVESQTFEKEIQKLNKKIEVVQNSAPLLVPHIESGKSEFIEPILKNYLEPLIEGGIDTLILGCTHYPHIKELVRNLIGDDIKVISQDEVVPNKLANYLKRHPETDKKLSKHGTRELLVTDITKTMSDLSEKWFGGDVQLKLVDI